MILGALLDAGPPPETLTAELAKLHLDNFHLHTKKVLKNCFSATKVDVHVLPHSRENGVAPAVTLKGLQLKAAFKIGTPTPRYKLRIHSSSQSYPVSLGPSSKNSLES